jgi:hypothetical protein
MFQDADWDFARADPQEQRLMEWLSAVGSRRLAIVECGAGSAIATVRRFSEHVAERHNATLIRLNPRESAVPEGQIGLAIGALEGLTTLDRFLFDRSTSYEEARCDHD